jgi:hypothetical protein
MLRNNLAKLMIDRGITATQLFNDTGIARSTISKISNNKTDKINISTVDKLCNYLMVSPADFFDYIPFEISMKAGFDNYDSLSELAEEMQFAFEGWEEPVFLIINIFHLGKKLTIEYQGSCFVNTQNFFKCSNIQFKISKDNDGVSDIIFNWPIQFQNDFAEIVREYIQSTFDIEPSSLEETIHLGTLLSPTF